MTKTKLCRVYYSAYLSEGITVQGALCVEVLSELQTYSLEQAVLHSSKYPKHTVVHLVNVIEISQKEFELFRKAEKKKYE